ncbi:MAG: hypothetical protein J7L15_00715 [Clostridiales bacterium]|nr:hypothetical protein [Clostridiales bacterium]
MKEDSVEILGEIELSEEHSFVVRNNNLFPVSLMVGGSEITLRPGIKTGLNRENMSSKELGFNISGVEVIQDRMFIDLMDDTEEEGVMEHEKGLYEYGTMSNFDFIETLETNLKQSKTTDDK